MILTLKMVTHNIQRRRNHRQCREVEIHTYSIMVVDPQHNMRQRLQQ